MVFIENIPENYVSLVTATISCKKSDMQKYGAQEFDRIISKMEAELKKINEKINKKTYENISSELGILKKLTNR